MLPLSTIATLGPPELLIILVLVLLVFGGAKLPKLARSLGQAQREFRDGLSEGENAESGPKSAASGVDSGRSGKNKQDASSSASGNPTGESTA